MLSKSQHRAKSAMRRPMSDVSNEVFDNQARFCKKEANKSAGESLDRLLVARSDLSGLISQIDNLVAQAIKQKEISKKGYQEIESFIGFLSGMSSSLKPWFARLQEALANRSVVVSSQPLKTHAEKNHSTPFPCKSAQESLLLASKNDCNKQLDLLVSPSPLVSWRTDHCTAIDGGKELFLLTPLQKSKGLLPTKPLINEKDTNKKHDDDDNNNNIQERDMGIRQTPRAVLPAQTIYILPEFGTVKTHQRHRKIGAPPNTCAKSGVRFCNNASKSALITKPLPLVEPVHEAVICGLPKSVLSNKQSAKLLPDMNSDMMPKKHEEIGVLGNKVADKKKKAVTDTLDWFFSPPKTCILMEPSDKKTCAADVKLSTPVNNNNNNKNDNKSKGGDEKLLGTPWNELYMSATCTKKGETTLKKELWTRFEAVSSTSDLRLSADLFQKNDGKGFLDLLDEAS